MIEDLENKLNGEIPVTKKELIELINSWGRVNEDDEIIFEVGECYDLSKVDTSEITNFDDLFSYSLFDGDVSNWNTSNATSMGSTFWGAKKFNSPLPWNMSKVTTMVGMFYGAESFNQPLNFNTPNLKNVSYMLWFADNFAHPINFDVSNLCYYGSMLDSKTFIERFNNGEIIENPKEWLEQNRDKMRFLSPSEKDKSELDSFFDEIENSRNSIKELKNESEFG